MKRHSLKWWVGAGLLGASLLAGCSHSRPRYYGSTGMRPGSTYRATTAPCCRRGAYASGKSSYGTSACGPASCGTYTSTMHVSKTRPAPATATVPVRRVDPVVTRPSIATEARPWKQASEETAPGVLPPPNPVSEPTVSTPSHSPTPSPRVGEGRGEETLPADFEQNKDNGPADKPSDKPVDNPPAINQTAAPMDNSEIRNPQPESRNPVDTLPADDGKWTKSETVKKVDASRNDTATAVVATKVTPRMGHADDYTWLCGQVQYSRINRTWRLRYTPVDQEDTYGGCVTIVWEVDDAHPEGLKEGQHVRVEGRLQDPDAKANAPRFRVSAIQIVQ